MGDAAGGGGGVPAPRHPPTWCAPRCWRSAASSPGATTPRCVTGAYAWSIVLSTVLLCRQPPPSCDCVAMTPMALQPWRPGSMCTGGQGLLAPQAALSNRYCLRSLSCQWPQNYLPLLTGVQHRGVAAVPDGHGGGAAGGAAHGRDPPWRGAAAAAGGLRARLPHRGRRRGRRLPRPVPPAPVQQGGGCRGQGRRQCLSRCALNTLRHPTTGGIQVSTAGMLRHSLWQL